MTIFQSKNQSRLFIGKFKIHSPKGRIYRDNEGNCIAIGRHFQAKNLTVLEKIGFDIAFLTENKKDLM
jgi:hypothetical protein